MLMHACEAIPRASGAAESDSPHHDRASSAGQFFAVCGQGCRRASPSRLCFSALRSCHAWSAGDALWPRRRSGDPVLSAISSVAARISRDCVAEINHAVKAAREIGHAPTLLFALACTTYTQICCRDYAAATPQLDEAHRLGRGKRRLVLEGEGDGSAGLRIGRTGKSADAVPMITSGISARSLNGRNSMDYRRSLLFLASAYADLRQIDEAWRCISEATTVGETTKERWH